MDIVKSWSRSNQWRRDARQRGNSRAVLEVVYCLERMAHGRGRNEKRGFRLFFVHWPTECLEDLSA